MRDFQHSKQKNPHRGLRNSSSVRRLALRIAFVVLLAGSYMVATMPPLRIQTVEVHASTEQGRMALERVTSDFLSARSLWIFPNRSLPLFRASRLRAAIEGTLPVQTLSIATKFKERKLAVAAAFRVPVARIQTASSTLYVDPDGQPLSMLLEPYDGRQLLEIRSARADIQTESTTRSRLSGKDLDAYHALKAYFEKTPTPVLWMVMPEDPDSITFQMTHNWQLLVARHDQRASITKRLDIFFRQRQNIANPKPLEYIDLRFGDKVVSKEK